MAQDPVMLRLRVAPWFRPTVGMLARAAMLVRIGRYALVGKALAGVTCWLFDRASRVEVA